MKVRNLIGYLMGLILFVILIPLIMWKISGEVHPNAAQLICLGVMAVIGIGLSSWFQQNTLIRKILWSKG